MTLGFISFDSYPILNLWNDMPTQKMQLFFINHPYPVYITTFHSIRWYFDYYQLTLYST